LKLFKRIELQISRSNNAGDTACKFVCSISILLSRESGCGALILDECDRRSVEISELKCYSAPIKSSSKIWWTGRQPCY